MCFYKKKRKAEVAKRDIYVIKYPTYGSTSDATEESFRAFKGFIYEKGAIQEKTLKDRWRAYWRMELNGEVFHCHGIQVSKWRIANSMKYNHEYPIGVFLIPKGTTFYRTKDNEQIATFSIKYVGLLTDEKAKLVLEQPDL